MPQFKVSATLNTYIDADSPEMAQRLAQDALTALVENKDAAVAEFEDRYPQDIYPGFLVQGVVAEDASVEAETPSVAVSQEELDNPSEVV
jgi:hypothetical protein